ncbi:UbiD family decarboxylase domain-containing protein [Chloroflexota bacterium]
MAKKDITDMRGTIEFLRQVGELITVSEEADSSLEIPTIQMVLDQGPAFLFEKVKGFPGAKDLCNVFARRDRIAKIFDVDDPKKLKLKCLEAVKKPIPPVEVDNAPSQEVVITGDKIDVPGTFPVGKQTEKDGAPVFGSGQVLVSGKYYRNAHDIAFKRMNFRGKDWASITASPGSHLESVLFTDFRKEDVPVTLNICTSPAVTVIAASGAVPAVMPIYTDELAIAGALEGSPIEICKAKTVDAYSLAKAEYVIEGLITTDKVWETDEAEELQKQNVAPFFPEWTGYLGRAWRSRKFQATAITHRKDPIFYNHLGATCDGAFAGLDFREAYFYEMAQRLAPGFVIDVHIPSALKLLGGVIFQVKKNRARDEGVQRLIIMHALSAQPGLMMAIAIDEDVSIDSMDDVMWAIMSRAKPPADFITGLAGSRAQGGGFGGGIAIDATVPFDQKEGAQRFHYPVENIDLTRWFTQQQIDAIKAGQREYAQLLAKKGG